MWVMKTIKDEGTYLVCKSASKENSVYAFYTLCKHCLGLVIRAVCYNKTKINEKQQKN